MHYSKLYKLLMVAIVLLLVAWASTLLIEQHRFSTVALDYSSSQDTPIVTGKLRKLHAGDIATIGCSFLYKGNIGPYDNLFQTAYANKGIRLEISEEQGWWVLASQADNTLQGVQLPTPKPNEWHDLKIIIAVEEKAVGANDPYKLKKTHTLRYDIKVWLDEMLVASQSLPDLSVNMNNVMLGGAFNGERVFNGDIKNFSCSVERTTKVARINGVYTLLIVGLALVGLFWLYKSHRSPNGPSAPDCKVKQYAIFILFCIAVVYIFQFTWPFSASLESSTQILTTASNWGLGIFALCGAAFFWFVITRDRTFFILITYVLCMEYFKTVAVRLSGLGFLADAFFIVCLFLSIRYIIKKISSPIFRMLLLSICVAVHFVLCLGLVGGVFYLMQYNLNTFDVHTLNAIFQTTLYEAYDFISTQASGLTLAAPCAISFCCTILFLFLILHQNTKETISVSYKKMYVPLVCGVFGATLIIHVFAGVQQSYAYPILNSYGKYLSQIEEMQYYAEQRSKIQAVEAIKEEKGETYIVLVGESVNREHLGAYGYFRDTTPWLSREVKQGNAVLFSNAYAAFCHTVPAVLPILTSANQYNGQSPFITPSLFEVLKASGFDTYAIYAQPIDFSVDNPLRVVLEQADKTYYPANRKPIDSDSTILPVFNTILESMDKSKNNFIFVELMGSHFDYARRYPPDYPVKFDDTGIEYLGGLHRKTDFIQNLLNPYDTSIHYTDYILSQLYEAVRENIEGPTVFIYMADHGEDVYGEKFHNGGLFTWPMVRVPFTAFFSEDYKTKYPEKVLGLEKAKDKIFTTDLFFDTFLNLANIKTKLYAREYDLGHKDYSINLTSAKTMTAPARFQRTNYPSLGAVSVSDDPELIKKHNLEELEKLAPGKFLANYTDAIASVYDVVAMGFKGIEFNINLKGHGVEIGHGEETIRQSNNLEQYLQDIPLESLSRLYIDVKNLEPSKIPFLYEQLLELDKKYKIKHRVIIESTVIDEQMAIFPTNGWYTNFYCFYPGSELHAMPVDKRASKILKVIELQKPNGLSFHSSYYTFIKKAVEPYIDEDVSYSTWDIPGLSLTDPHIKKKLNEHVISSDKRVKIILFEAGSEFKTY